MNGDMNVEYAPISSVMQDPSNVRKHDDRNIQAIMASLAKFGQQTPIVVGTNRVIQKGNGTYEAAKKLGWTHVHVVTNTLSGTEAIAYSIADNRTGELSEWDHESLDRQLQALHADGWSLLEIGFNEKEMTEIKKAAEPRKTMQDEAVPYARTFELVKKWNVQPGDIYYVESAERTANASEPIVNGAERTEEAIASDADSGIDESLNDTVARVRIVPARVHTLACVDCTDADAVRMVLRAAARMNRRDARADGVELVFTSPPYWTGQEYDDKPGLAGIQEFMKRWSTVWSRVPRRRIVIQTGHTTSTTIGVNEDERHAPIRLDKDVNVQREVPFHKVLLDSMWTDALYEYGWRLRHRRMWNKEVNTFAPNPDSDLIDDSTEVILTYYHPQHYTGGQERIGTQAFHEWVVKGMWIMQNIVAGLSKNENVAYSDRVAHPCPYPIELVARYIEMYTKEGQTVCDPFIGSGTTLVAADKLKRVCVGFEKQAEYCAVALERFTNNGMTVRKVENV